ncbi:hypothetical protein DFAR_1600002 [Desulfarculales bacterium]
MGSYNLTDKIKRKNKFTEVDLTAEYAFEFGDFSFPWPWFTTFTPITPSQTPPRYTLASLTSG